MRRENEKIELCVQIRHYTERALLVTDGSKDKDGKEKEQWIPRSQIETDDPITLGGVINISIPKWLAEEKDFVF